MADPSNPNSSADLKSNDRQLKNFLGRLGIPVGLLGLLMFAFTFLPEDRQDQLIDFLGIDSQVIGPDSEVFPVDLPNFFPSSPAELIDHSYFKLSYSENDEQAEWVAYELKASQLRSFSFERRSSFRMDPKVSRESASPSDYTNSGYDRGHLAPAADMAYSDEAMKASFYMSNVSPQQPSFNRGIWKELEEQSRDWARERNHLYVITGPVLSQRAQKRLRNNVKAPASFFKILLDLNKSESKAAAFLMPNEGSDKRLSEYMVSVDSVEALTGLDFFPQLPDELENRLERESFVNKWPFDEERYQLRIGLWNKMAASAVFNKSYE